MNQRPNPDQLLEHVQAEEKEAHRGRLKLFFGASPGVGKTYAMLEAARQRKKEGVDIIIGIVETHGRSETAALLDGLEVLPRKLIDYRGVQLKEFDLDAALARRPALILVDELAHTNAPSSRHPKRWQDVEELLDAGISIYTTLNVQHWESLNDVVAKITGVVIRETVPDTFLARAYDVELIDLPPEELLKRLKEGKVYLGEQAARAADHFFQPGNLIALRELALRHTAERVDAQMQAFKARYALGGMWRVGERLLVGISASPLSVRLVRATMRLATQLHAPWHVIYVETLAAVSPEMRAAALQTLHLAEELGAEIQILSGQDVTEELLRFARTHHVTKIILGKPARPRWREWIYGSIVNQIARRTGDIDLYVISGVGGNLKARRPPIVTALPPWQEAAAALVVVALCTLLCWPLARALDRTNLVMIYLLGIMGVAYRYGRVSSTLASILGVLAFDYFFVPPYHSFAVSDSQYLITFGVMLAGGLFISALTGRLRRQAGAMRRRIDRLQMLYQMSRALSETPDPAVLLNAAAKRLEDFYKTPVLVLVPDENNRLVVGAGATDILGFSGKEGAAAQWAFDHAQAAGAGTDTLAGASGLYLPLKGIQSTMGVLAIRPLDSISFKDPEQWLLLETIAGEIGGALESTQMSEAAGRAREQVQTERLRNLLLSSFSFELHAPLMQISQLCEELLNESKPNERVRQALEHIRQQACHIDDLAKELPEFLREKA